MLLRGVLGDVGGWDAASGKDYEHRKAWIRSRLEFLAMLASLPSMSWATFHSGRVGKQATFN